MDAFEQYMRAGLERIGMPVEDVEIEIARYADQLYGPEVQALMEDDLKGVWVEPDLDPSRAPTQ